MMQPYQDRPKAGVPAVFLWLARLLPVALAGQFLLAGGMLFGGTGAAGHSVLGALIAVPALGLLGYSLAVRRLRGLRWWAGVIAVLYLLQIALAAAGPAGLVFHPFNAALLLGSALVLLAKIERRRARG